MSLHFYNTWTKTLEEFQPIDRHNVRVYACGPTVHNRIHVGNGRMTVVFDLLVRLLRQVYGKEHVTYVSNITDIEDKIIAAAGANLSAIAELTHTMTIHYWNDRTALGCLTPDIEPRATEYIPQMIAMITALIDADHAYVAEGHVLFAVGTSPEYGRLSGRNRDDQIAGARVEVAPYKRDPADFVLWKPSADDLPGWDSPWGRGRPGWHIECSAMTADTLGMEFDIHGGGIDLTFPHHENEIAQSRCAHGVVPARLWMHNGHLTVDGQKMSKSLGNFVTVEDVLRAWPGEAVRLALMSTHYRSPSSLSDEGLTASKARLDYLYGVIARAGNTCEAASPAPEVIEALSDDLNSPKALSELQRLAGEADAGRLDASVLLASATVLGLLQQSPEDWFRWQPPGSPGPDAAEIESAIAARIAARAARDFAEADRVRQSLLAEGVALEDSASGTTWKRVGPA